MILPIGNLLGPRKKYRGLDHHKILLDKQHQIFIRARNRIKRTQKKRNKRVNKGRKEVELSMRDPVFYKVHLRERKLDRRWEPYFKEWASDICNLGPNVKVSEEDMC